MIWLIPDPNEVQLRIELGEELMITINTGDTRMVNAARVHWKDQHGRAHPRWLKAISGPLIATGDKAAGECSYADLLEALARLIRQEEDS